jgi:uncharacterized damage-inducible protein DinB
MTLENFLSYCDYLVKSTEILFQQVPPDKVDWKPTDGSFTIGQQMSHIAGAFEVYAHGITTGNWGFTSIRERFLKNRHQPTVSVEDAIKAMNDNHREFRRLVGALGDDEFNGGAIDTPQLGGKVPRWRIGMLFIEHHLYHKAELFMYLKLLGVKVNSGHLYRS